MKKLILAICIAVLSASAYANSPVEDLSKVSQSSKAFFLKEVAFARLKSKCGVTWSGYIHYESSSIPSVEIANFVDRLHDMQEAIDKACGTSKTVVYF